MRTFAPLIVFGLTIGVIQYGYAQSPTELPSVPLTSLPIGVSPIPGTPEAEQAARQAAEEKIQREHVEPPRILPWVPAAESPETALAFMPADAEAGFVMRGKHLPPVRRRPESKSTEITPVFVPPPPMDVSKELERVRHGLFYMCTGDMEMDAKAVADRLFERDVLWAAQSMQNIVNTLQIGFSGGMQSYSLIAFREPLDAAFYESLRGQTKGVVRVRNIDVIQYESDAAIRISEHERQFPNQPRPAGPSGSESVGIRLPADLHLAALAPNVLAIFPSREHAEQVITRIADGATFAVRRPGWLTWDADSTFVGFQTYRNRGADALKGTPAATDPNARGMLVRWNQSNPQQLTFQYLTDLVDVTPHFEAMKKHEFFGRARYQRHPEGTIGTITIGEKLPDDYKAFDGGHACFTVYYLCGMIIMP